MNRLEIAYLKAEKANFHPNMKLNDYSIRFGFWQRLNPTKLSLLNLVSEEEFEEVEDDDFDGFSRFSYQLKTKK